MVIFFWIVGVLWALQGCFAILMDFAGYRFGMIPIHAAISFWLLAVMVWRSRRTQEAHASVAAGAGVQQGSGFQHAEGGTAIALNAEAKTLTMRAGAAQKTYAYESIREWRVVKETAGEVVGGGLAGVGVQLRANKKARLASGLFVTVKDIDFPVWRIEMKSEAMQQRWMEILRQEVNEDRAA